MIRQEIIKLIQKATAASLDDIRVAYPEKGSFGDYTTNIALRLKKPADEIVRNLKSDLFEKIEVAAPGFINFFLSKEYLQKQVGTILKEKESFGELRIGRGQKVNIEFISANPTGPLHIGNGRSAFTGDVLANILEFAGYKVVREYYINDDVEFSAKLKDLTSSAHIVWNVDGEEITKIPYLNEYFKSVVSDLKSKKLSSNKLGEMVISRIQKDNNDFIEKKLNIDFDRWVSEKDYIHKSGRAKKILSWLKNNDLVYEKEGALWLKTSQFGDDKDWVVVRKSGDPTYFLSDIAYHKDKFDRGFDKVIDIWGADHQAHVAKMKAAAKMLGFKGSLDILVLQLVTLRGGEKMSKYSGNIITLEELVDEIGLDVARWFYLQKSLNTHTEIDLALAKEQSEKNPVYYVQYAHARICSIFAKSKIKNKGLAIDHKLLCHPSELRLIRQLIKLPEIIEDTANDYQVQRLPQYATDLATAFHQFYRDCQVLSENIHLARARLSLVSATQVVLNNTLSLMGISAPEKM